MTKLASVGNENCNNISESEYIKRYAKQMLKNSLFIGTFREKRFVEPLNSYRDVINIAKEEEDFIKNLIIVKRRIRKGFLKIPWIGITDPDAIGAPAGYNLWVVLTEEVFGKYWYKVKSVEFLNNEIRLRLEIIRPVHDLTPSKRNLSPEEVTNVSSDDFNLSACLSEAKLMLKENLRYFYQTIITFENIKNSIIFISLLLTTFVASSVNTIKYLLDYLLKLLRELTLLINVMTPIIINFLNLLGKTIFGFYQLILLLFQGKPKPQPVYNAYFNVDPQNMVMADPRERYNKYFDRGLPYPSRRSGPTITPL